mgnify:FL=1
MLEWESLHCAECPTPKLLRFHGRPDDLSPKARLKLAFGLVSKPFDRHDWTVDRCGKHVRYILDYYDVKAKPGEESRMPMLHDEDAVPTIEMDIRPALDSPGALYDRMRLLGRSISSMLPTMATAAASEAARSPVVAALAATEEAGSAEVEAVRKSCAKCYDALAQCENEKDCGLAQVFDFSTQTPTSPICRTLLFPTSQNLILFFTDDAQDVYRQAGVPRAGWCL